MLSRRQFLTRSLQGLLAAGPRLRRPAVHRQHRPGRRSRQGQHPRRHRNDRRQRRPQHRHPLRRRPLSQVPPDACARPRTRSSRSTTTSACNSGMRSFDRLLQQRQLAVVQGVGYPNPDRSHFESMDIWQSADPTRKTTTGWLGRSVNELHSASRRHPDHAHRPRPPAAGPAGRDRRRHQHQQPAALSPRAGRRHRGPAEGAPQAARRPGPAGQGRRRRACSSSSTAARCRR